ncbi:MAG: VWA-like domain-containing protein [Rectinemataceae bacterium]
MNLGDEIARSAITLLGKEPFYAHILGAISRVETTKIETCGVRQIKGTIELAVNPQFFLTKLKQMERVAVLKHEIMHIALGHLRRRDPKRQPMIENIAMDLVVNQLVPPWPLPENAVMLSSFPDFKADQTFEHYYALLSKILENMKQKGWEPGEKDGNEGGNLTKQESSLAKHYGKDMPGNHEWAETGKGLTEAEKIIADAIVGQIVINAAERCSAKERGTLPAGILEEIEALRKQKTSKVDWRRQLRIFSASCGRSKLKATVMRRSKRFGSFPGIRTRRYHRILVAVDTSGSVGNKELNLFFAEISRIWRTGTEVFILEADAEIGKAYEYTGKFSGTVTGRGGTDFTPVVEYARENRSKYDGLIYFTDGFAPCPDRGPAMRMLWMITENGSSETFKFGVVVRLELDD